MKPGFAISFNFWTGRSWEFDLGFTTTSWCVKYNRSITGFMLSFGPLWISTFDASKLQWEKLITEESKPVDMESWLN